MASNKRFKGLIHYQSTLVEEISPILCVLFVSSEGHLFPLEIHEADLLEDPFVVFSLVPVQNESDVEVCLCIFNSD